MKNVFLEILENTCARVSFLITEASKAERNRDIEKTEAEFDWKKHEICNDHDNEKFTISSR